MSADIDPAFADRCTATAIGLRQLAELGARQDADDDAVALAARVTAELLSDPEALLAVALVIEQRRAAVVVALTSPAWRPVPGAAQPPPAPPPRDDDLSTLHPGETRLVGGKMWARCKRCSFVGPLEGRGTWHVCDPVSAPPLGGQAP